MVVLVPPRMGRVMWRVAFWGMERVDRVGCDDDDEEEDDEAVGDDVGNDGADDGIAVVGGAGGGGFDVSSVFAVGDVEVMPAVRCRPAWTRRIEGAGADVRTESRCWRWVMGVEEGTVSGIAVEMGLSAIRYSIDNTR